MGKHRDDSNKPDPQKRKDHKPEHYAPELPQRKGDGTGGKPSPNPKGVKRLS